jgi:hypothetical protein
LHFFLSFSAKGRQATARAISQATEWKRPAKNVDEVKRDEKVRKEYGRDESP